MTENDHQHSPNRFRGAWEAFRRGRESSRSRPEPETEQPRDVSAEEIALSRIEAEAPPYVSPGLKLAAAWSWRSLIVLVAVGVALWLLSKISSVVLPVLIALLLAALLAPPTARSEERRVGKEGRPWWRPDQRKHTINKSRMWVARSTEYTR